jgi:hypothetical protein
MMDGTMTVPTAQYDYFARAYSFWAQFYKYITVKAVKITYILDFEPTDDAQWGDRLNSLNIYLGWYYNIATGLTGIQPARPSANRLTDWLTIRDGKWVKGSFKNQLSTCMKLKGYFDLATWEDIQRDQFEAVTAAGTLGPYTGTMNSNGLPASFTFPTRKPTITPWIGVEFSGDNSNVAAIQLPNATCRCIMKYYCMLQGPYYTNMNQFFNTGTGPNESKWITITTEEGKQEVRRADHLDPEVIKPSKGPEHIGVSGMKERFEKKVDKKREEDDEETLSEGDESSSGGDDVPATSRSKITDLLDELHRIEEDPENMDHDDVNVD